jgi:hypothetical protein
VVGGSAWTNNVQTWLTFDQGAQDNLVNAEDVPFMIMPLAAPKAGVCPQLIKMTDSQMTLQGYRIHVGLETGTALQDQQSWKGREIGYFKS